MSKHTEDICSNGHDRAKVGVYKIRGTRRCKQCQRDSIERARHRSASLREHPEELVGEEIPRFISKISKTDSCWIWQASGNGLGYGIVMIAGRTKLAHRVSYRHHVGPIPDGMEIDHLCRNRGCVNPDHLEPVTHRVNSTRAVPFRPSESFAKHGTRAKYKRGCRCASCRAANTLMARMYRERKRLEAATQ